jgi:hypothetical protein
MVTLDPEPIVPDCVICNPATLPAKELARFESFMVFTLSPDTSETA